MLFRRKGRRKWSGNRYRYGNYQDQRENRDLQSRCRYREATVAENIASPRRNCKKQEIELG